MRLSEAILLGSTMGPQAHGTFQAEHFDGQTYRCALGAALAAMGRAICCDEQVNLVLDELWPHLRDDTWLPCPARCGGTSQGLGALIVHLNDMHGWTRERIAEHVATVEPQDTDHELTDGRQVPVPSAQCTETCCVENGS
jgi:hypothetical protein